MPSIGCGKKVTDFVKMLWKVMTNVISRSRKKIRECHDYAREKNRESRQFDADKREFLQLVLKKIRESLVKEKN